ncbi:imm11 family protein [Myxococcus sp. RHSTA-1-4]|uniref:imm11 family protein n=1 Tax=Myxococcus sp. RHSTA-1-4 TaxID=2874601 RepID=UPI001CBD6DBC|nr:DUF1629 domain-containing protein [Myxococcus sp. RHSTA-1-4]MBZ4422604.1 hypothetical protein [Myxococcus sp. RHSTA-1-4]
MSYWIVSEKPNGGAVLDMLPDGSPEEFLFGMGGSLAAEFPQGGVMKFSSLFPQFIKVYDFVTAVLPVLVVSSRVKRVMDALEVGNCEFLPVVLKDHKGNVAATEYFVLHALGGQDAIDMEHSVYKMGALDEDQIKTMKKLVLSPQNIDPKALLFRPSRMMYRFMMHQRLLDALKSEGVTGLHVYPADGWDGSDLV